MFIDNSQMEKDSEGKVSPLQDGSTVSCKPTIGQVKTSRNCAKEFEVIRLYTVISEMREVTSVEADSMQILVILLSIIDGRQSAHRTLSYSPGSQRFALGGY